MIQIKNRYTGTIIKEVDANTLSGANLSGADLSRANLSGADLSRANLSGANLSGANLYGANLSGANLYGANLSGANLYGANLYGADLSRANLSGANLYGANLSRADLSGADLSGADLYGGVTWEEFLDQVVPALLASGERSVEEVLATGCWKCHRWENCPMHEALAINDASEAPVMIRPWVRLFVTLFDGGNIPEPRQLEDGRWTCLPEEKPAVPASKEAKPAEEEQAE